MLAVLLAALESDTDRQNLLRSMEEKITCLIAMPSSRERSFLPWQPDSVTVSTMVTRNSLI